MSLAVRKITSFLDTIHHCSTQQSFNIGSVRLTLCLQLSVKQLSAQAPWMLRSVCLPDHLLFILLSLPLLLYLPLPFYLHLSGGSLFLYHSTPSFLLLIRPLSLSLDRSRQLHFLPLCSVYD